MEEAILLSLIFSAASFTQGVTGFGFGIIVMPLLSLSFNPGTAVAMNVLAGSVNCVYNFILFRSYVNYAESLKTVMLCSIFVPLGALFLISVDQRIVFLSLGMLIIIIALHSMKGIDGKRRIYKKLGLPFKIATGLIAGAFASPGPVLAPYYYAVNADAIKAKANLQFIFSMLNIFVIISHAAAGNLNAAVAVKTLPYLPLVFLFTKVGAVLSIKLNMSLFRRIVHVSLCVLGLYLVVQNITAF